MDNKPKCPIRQAASKFFSINKLFSRCIIIGCLAYMTHVTERVLEIAEVHGLNCYNILAAAGVVFGGELLLLAFKDVIADKVTGVIETAKAKIKDNINNDKDCD